MSSNQGPWSWSAPLHRSRSGASHQRRGVPCQDSSLTGTLRSADGLEIGLMAVADGHGGSRYWLSDAGSQLACQLMIQLAGQDLAGQPLENGPDQLEAVYRWLAYELPGRIVTAWQEAIRADWQTRQLPPEKQGEPFSPQTYGTTLALVITTPGWWAHTGLGDWDLVLLSSDQPDCIISQENDDGLQAEATESLCLPSARSCFAARTAVYSLLGERRKACGLMLSTDGVRKSCAADADHLALSRFLLEEIQQLQERSAGETHLLDASLDRISREGSGDDVTVALACFGDLHPANATGPTGAVTKVAPTAANQSAHLPISNHLRASSSASITSPRKRNLASTLLSASALLATAGIALLAWFRLMPTWIWPPPTQTIDAKEPQALALSIGQQQGLRQQIKRLCSQPELIETNLRARNIQFHQLRDNQAAIKRVVGERDWLGTLIGLSQPGGQGLGLLNRCPELTQALRQYWQLHLNPDATMAGRDD
ncbi:protein phosphatase 2C domain-containing protein [Cyanobium sp. WKJ7-Wakatipu]|uniref:protein phosphatase 2C domain-containing protein n=1 Tax=Cyanobium sp. WKJ7-Wakatipu TaxID=2823726 RepID=UPI0020CF773E|nr:protein phosphatase 2C domain-containing protein [Cyanobium sp. WKJ7-Wakatipu]MCP9784593.1 protein phosphatase 2C domain-containing protein [Cyanobium sp. WKJ7-Wakatipu]